MKRRWPIAEQPLFIGFVFFLSGFPALIYQLTWQRSLFTIFGTNVEAVTVVVAGFLFGLGIGSLAGGELSRRHTGSLLMLFGAIELSVGIFGIFSLRLFALAGAHTLFLPPVVTTAVVLALLFLPTLLMGSTLPILTAYLVTRSRNVGGSVGLLYCVNTLGSAFACFGCAVGLMRLNGMQGQVNLAASINFLIGVAALTAAYRGRSGSSGGSGSSADQPPPAIAAARVPPPAAGQRGFGLGHAIALAAIIGYLSLSYEIAWFRTFELANDTAGAFAIVLGTYLAGIANGSLRARRRFQGSWTATQGIQIIARSIFAATLIGFFLLPLTAAGILAGVGYFDPMIILIFLQASLLGGLFAVLCHASIAAGTGAGAQLSLVYLGNILGSVAGTLITGFVLMDHLSMAGILLWLAIVGIAVAVILATLAARSTTARLAAVGGGIAVIVILALPAGRLFAPVYAALIYKSAPTPAEEFTDVVENKSGVITVSKAGVVYGGGAYDGMIALDMLDDTNLLIRPFSLTLFHPHPENVLMIGLATGAWAQVLANNPALRHLTIVEINPGYLPIIQRYPIVADLLKNPKVSIVIDDGRRWLNRHPGVLFDAIIQNTTWNYRPNVTNLLSAEYLELLRRHLQPDGIALYNTTSSLRAQRTACREFPGGMRELNAMIVSPQPLHLDHDRLRAVLGAYRIDGQPVFDLADPRYRARFEQVIAMLDPDHQASAASDAMLENCTSLLARTQGLAPITDDNMGEEWGFIQGDPALQSLRHALGL